MRIELSGVKKAVAACDWLKQKNWQYNITVTSASPFAGQYVFDIPDQHHALMFKLRWA